MPHETTLAQDQNDPVENAKRSRAERSKPVGHFQKILGLRKPE